MKSSFRTFCIALCCFMATVAMALPASDGLFYCFPMQRVMIEDCCGEDTEEHSVPVLTHAQCCEKMDAFDVDTPVSSATPAISSDVSHGLVLKRILSASELIDTKWNYSTETTARGPPPRGPPHQKGALFLRNQTLLI
jgi:hypothetical protein